jgi:hypothetical protein
MKIMTFTTYLNEDTQALTLDEFNALPEAPDWTEYVWQEAPDKPSAIARHQEAMDAYEDDNTAGKPIKETY